MNLRPLIVLCVAMIATPLAAHDFKSGTLAIAHPWTRETTPGQRTASGYMVIANKGKANDRLLGGSSPAADKVAVHSMHMDGNIMRMRLVNGGLMVPAGRALTLEPGRLHIMLVGLKQPLKRGELVPLTLRFAQAGTVRVELKVEPIDFASDSDHSRH